MSVVWLIIGLAVGSVVVVFGLAWLLRVKPSDDAPSGGNRPFKIL